jgi:hypothetical protein
VSQVNDVWAAMSGGEWKSLRTLAAATGHPEASISARLRDFRKARYGSHVVELKPWRDRRFQYRLVRRMEIAA